MQPHWNRLGVSVRTGTMSVLMFIALQPVSWGDDLDGDKPYRAWKVTTDLHRELVDPKISSVLVVGADGLCENGVVNPSQLDFLDVATKGNLREKVSLQFVTSRGVSEDRRSRRVLELAIRAYLEDLTHTKPAVSWTYVGGRNEFEKMTADLESDPPEGTGVEEPFITTSVATIAPVRTPLSRFLTGDCDCYIQFREPWKKLGDEVLSAELRMELKAAIDELDLVRRDKVMMTIRVQGESGREASDRFVNQHREAFAADLGFKFISVRNEFQ